MRKRIKTALLTILLGSMLLMACSTQSPQNMKNSTENSTVEGTELVDSAIESTAKPTDEATTDSITTEVTTEPTPEPISEAATQTTEAPRKEVVIDPDKPLVALTFDDGPNQSTTVQVLDLLEEHDVTASFFLIGSNINMNTMSVVKRAYDMGCEINNHSKTHSYMNAMTSEEIKAEIDTVNTLITNITGEAPKFFRPPFIAVSDTMYEAIDMPFICGVGCNDWEASVTAEQRAEKTLEQVKDGTIILLHDSYGNTPTVEALKTIIPTLLDEGYQFVTVSQLFEAKGVEISAEDTNLYSVVE